MDGRGIRSRDARGRPIIDDSFLLLISAEPDPIDWKLPEMDGEWVVELDTALPTGVADDVRTVTADIELVPRSTVLLRFRPADDDGADER
jgi:glycogen operon protein